MEIEENEVLKTYPKLIKLLKSDQQSINQQEVFERSFREGIFFYLFFLKFI